MISGYRWFQRRFFEAYVEEIKHFVKVIKGEVEPIVTGYDALKALETAEAVKKSIAEKKP